MRALFVPLIAFSLFARVVATFWWSSVAQLSMHASGPSSAPFVAPQPDCRHIDGLSAGQARMCRLFGDHLPFVGLGARDAILECQHQFKQRRWNCSTHANGIMGPVHNQGTKEAAFTYAIVSAGVAHQIARGCKMGLLESCGCGSMITTTRKNRRARKSNQTPQEIWHREGCSDNIQHGFKFAQDFIDVREKEKIYEKGTDEYARAAMNRWNNHIGRKLIKRRVKMKCKCHGVSGSCDIKTCWDHLSPLREIGKALVRKYDSALHVQVSKYGSLRILQSEQSEKSKYSRSSKIRKKRKGSIRANRMQLVYIKESPDYCKVNRTLGLTGTSGRQCRKEGSGPESCEDVCCGRGYNTHVRKTKERCNCDFKWCCRVECDLCERIHYVHTCKADY